MLTRSRLRSAMENITMDDFVKSFLAALEDTRVVDRFRLILHPSIMENLEPVTGALKTTVADLQQTDVPCSQLSRKRTMRYWTWDEKLLSYAPTRTTSSSTVVEPQLEYLEYRRARLAPQMINWSTSVMGLLACSRLSIWARSRSHTVWAR